MRARDWNEKPSKVDGSGRSSVGAESEARFSFIEFADALLLTDQPLKAVSVLESSALVVLATARDCERGGATLTGSAGAAVSAKPGNRHMLARRDTGAISSSGISSVGIGGSFIADETDGESFGRAIKSFSADRHVSLASFAS